MSNLQEDIDEIGQRGQSQQHDHILDLISTNNYASQQRDFLSKRTEGTGKWLLESNEYQRWLKDSGQTLFCHGMPGSGKTIMSSIVVDELLRQYETGSDTYVAYIFCNFRLQHQQSAEMVFSSLLRQLVQRCSKIPEFIKSLYAREKNLPNLAQTQQAFGTIAQSFRKGFVVIDALDECAASYDPLRRLVSLLIELQSKTGFSLFVTCRKVPRIEELFTKCIRLEIRANDGDVEKYVQTRLPSLPTYVRGSRELQGKIKRTIVRHVQGMFLLAQLHLDSLVDKKSKTAMKRALDGLDSGEHAYDIAYDKAMERIKGQTRDQAELATQALSWITFAKRPLTTGELQHALAVEFEDYGLTSLDLENFTDLDHILSVCAGLVTIDAETNVIRLVHHTTQQYFDRVKLHRFPLADLHIATVCIRYLSYQNVAPGPLFSRSDHSERLTMWPLYSYASEFWYEHIDKTNDDQDTHIINFLEAPNIATSAYQAAVIARYAPYEESDYSYYYFVSWDFDFDQQRPIALHWATFMGHDRVTRKLLERGYNAEQEDFEGMTPMMVAARRGHNATVRMMLEEWQISAKTSPKGLSPLAYATTFGQEGVVRVLLEHSEVDRGGTGPLGQAIALGRSVIVKLLLDDPRVEPNVSSPSGLPGLSIAISSGFQEIAEALLTATELDVNAADEVDRTGLHTAILCDNPKITQLLLNHPDVDTLTGFQETTKGRTPLALAALNGHYKVVALLLGLPNVDVNSRDEGGRTALSLAIDGDTLKVTTSSPSSKQPKPEGLDDENYRREAVIRTLLESKGIDPELMDDRGWSPLLYAVAGGNERAVSPLLSSDHIAVDRLGPSGTTALFYARNVTIARLLINSGAHLDWHDARGMTAVMHHYHKYSDSREVLEFLCQQGADLHLVDSDGETLLMRAARQGDAWMVNTLLRNGADPNNTGKNGRSILLTALQHSPKSVSDAFIEKAASGGRGLDYDRDLVVDAGRTKAESEQERVSWYRAVVGLLLKWGADGAFSQLDLLKLKSKKTTDLAL
ncbi:Uu.00g039490.m01.CDS01 [Anthostomella pinea]|uniref:Uu.00g039490.m01.CDS01 n=1 Tax=Anthostomella pinea TaxID=933095 RepID=A0AAI8VA14_9PEZI|nr:Uu.00g039490.m01.CDS01 [Anthostomella pinea]